jgi:hypothetical protein
MALTTILSYVFENGKNLEDEIMLRAQIFRVDESATRDHIGRYNLSTTSEHYQAALVWLDTELPKLIERIPKGNLGEFDGCVERVTPRVPSSRHDGSVNSGQSSTRSYLSILTSFYGADESDDDVPPQIFRKNRLAPQLTFDFNTDLDFPALPNQTAHPVVDPARAHRSPAQSTKSTSSSITMSEIHAVRSEMQAKFDADLKEFKSTMASKLENDIADAVKNSVATAMLGINAKLNELFQANNKIIYNNMQSERTVITDTMATAVSNKVDLAVNKAITRALKDFSDPGSSSDPDSPFRKKGRHMDKENTVIMEDGDNN